ncbi:MAG TPA: hypothetical protein VF422_01370 [Dokdonella sp.]
MLRSLEWIMAALVAAGMIALGYVLVTETMEMRERLLMGAALPVMGIFVWACVAPPLAGRSRWIVATIFAASLAVLFATMIGESRSLAAWAGLVMFANAGGLVLFRRGPVPVSGR